MSGDLTTALRTAQSGLLTNQQALDAIASNVSNVNTPGYSRKIINLEQRVLSGNGAGVKLSQFTRRIDQELVVSLRKEMGTLGALSVQRDYLDRVETLFGSPESNTSLSHRITAFTDAIEDLATDPESTLQQGSMVRKGEDLVLSFQQSAKTLQDLRLQADVRIGRLVGEANDLIGRIAELNDRILRQTTVNDEVTDLLDERDRALDRLSEIMDVQIFSRGDSGVVVFTSSGDALVDKANAAVTHVSAANMGAANTHAGGDIGGIFVGPAVAENDIANDLKRGELAGLVVLRDKILPNLQSALDELGAEVRDAVNREHNRGISFPGLQSATGTRVFVEPAVQTISLQGGGDVRLALLTEDGSQHAITTVETIMQSAAFGSGAQPATGPWTVDEVRATVEDWLQANGAPTASVSFDADGHIDIKLNQTSLNLALRDESGSAPGSAWQDVVIGHDKDGDGAIDETHLGFSSFFGLNDFFVTAMPDNIHESNALSASFSSTAATLTFRDSAGAIGAPIAIAAGSSLNDIADAISTSSTSVTASVVPDGGGFRLRLSSNDGASFNVIQDVGAGDTLLNDLGLHRADVGVSAVLNVRADILSEPEHVSRGALQWDPNRGLAGEYIASVGDDAAIQGLAAATSNAITFEAAGGLVTRTETLSGFAASIIGENAAIVSATFSREDFQSDLVDNLRLKSDSVRGVNLDEELSDLLLFEQAYSAAARVISVITEMFDALERAV